jgi:hypothetical protein
MLSSAQKLIFGKLPEVKSTPEKLTFTDEDEEEYEEDTIRGFSFGLNVGVYFANKKTANFYNGACYDNEFIDVNEVRCYSIEERLGATDNIFFDQTYNEVVQQVGNGATGFIVPFDSYPQNMRYSPGFLVGLHIKYNFNRYSAIVFNLNTMRLRTNDKFSLQFFGGPIPINAQNDVRLFTIQGVEQRFKLNLGYRQGWMMGDRSNFYLQAGGSMLGTQFESNQLVLSESLRYDLFLGIQNQQINVQPQQRTDIGFGGYVSTGFEFWFNSKYTMDLSFGLSRDKVILYSLEENAMNKWLTATFTL